MSSWIKSATLLIKSNRLVIKGPISNFTLINDQTHYPEPSITFRLINEPGKATPYQKRSKDIISILNTICINDITIRNDHRFHWWSSLHHCSCQLWSATQTTISHTAAVAKWRVQPSIWSGNQYAPIVVNCCSINVSKLASFCEETGGLRLVLWIMFVFFIVCGF